jgi:transcriptional regulator with XRE-family HTH domain
MSETHNKPALGAIFRQKREEKGLLIRQVAAVTELDQAIVSRIENSDRLPTREQVIKFAGLYGLDLKETISTWLAEKMVREYGDDPYAPEAFQEANDHILRHTISSTNLCDFSTLENEPSSAYSVNKNTPAKRGRKPKKPDTLNP